MRATIEIVADSRQVKTASQDLKNLQQQGQRTEQSTKKLRGSLGGVGRSAGQAGIQVQQLVGQIQGGVSPFVALSQQAADLGFVLGVPLIGAVVSIAAAFGGTLLPNLFESEEQTEELTEALRKLQEQAGLTANQAAFLAQEERKQLEASKERARELQEQIDREIELIRVRESAGVGTETGQFAVPRSAAENQARYAEAIEESTETIIRKRAELDKLNAEIEQSERNLSDLGEGSQKAAELQQRLIESGQELSRRLQILQVRQEEGEVAARKWQEAYKLGLETVEDLPESIALLIEANYQEEQAIEAVTEAQRKKIAADREAAREAERLAREKERQRERDTALGQTIGLSDEALIRQQLNDQLVELERLKNENLLSEEASYQERRANLIAEAEERIAQLQESTQLIDWESFGNQATGALAAVATGAMSGREAVRGLAMSLAQEAIGALIKLGVQSIATTFAASSAEQTAKATSATTTAATMAATTAAVAGAAGAATAAWSVPATLASIATLGGASATGVAALSAALASGIAATAAATATSAAANTGLNLISGVSGGRAHGGQVIGGNSYLVGERGPEIVTMGGNGNVTPYNNLMRAANQRSEQKVNVIVENYGSERATVREETMSDERIIRVVVGDINARREIPKALSQVGNYQNRAR